MFLKIVYPIGNCEGSMKKMASLFRVLGFRVLFRDPKVIKDEGLGDTER